MKNRTSQQRKRSYKKTQMEIIGLKNTVVKNIIIDNKIKVAGWAYHRQNVRLMT